MTSEARIFIYSSQEKDFLSGPLALHDFYIVSIISVRKHNINYKSLSTDSSQWNTKIIMCLSVNHGISFK